MRSQQNFCDRCRRTVDGDVVDFINALKCGHDICDNCLDNTRQKHPEAKHPMAWCPICEGEVKTGYAA